MELVELFRFLPVRPVRAMLQYLHPRIGNPLHAFSGALRGEFFDDRNGTRLPTPGGAGFGDYQNAWEVTGTFKVVLAEGLMLRTEYRYDAAHHSLFDKRLVGTDNTQDDQHTIAAELSYVF